MNNQNDEGLTTADLAGRGHHEPAIATESEMTREDTGPGMDVTNRVSHDGDSMHAPDGNVTSMQRGQSPGTGSGAGEMSTEPLLRDRDTYSSHWQDIQTRFVDEPQESVREADALVADVIQKLAQRFAEQRDQLEGKWHSGAEVNTEDLRQALQQYRSFFNRLLAA